MGKRVANENKITCINLFFAQCHKPISWNEVFKLYNKSRSGLSLVPKLKYEHVNLTSFSKMRVDLAAQVLQYNNVD